MRARDGSLILAAALVLGLAGCDRSATADPNAQGSLSPGNPRSAAAPSAADTASSRLSGAKGSLPGPGSFRYAVPGGTGSGTSDPGERSQTPQPGTGLQGGLGGGLGMTGSFPPGGDTTVSWAHGDVGSGSAGTRSGTSRSQVGNR
jgi:hypothetical protein